MKRGSFVFAGIGAAALLVIAVAVFMPVLDGPGSRQAAREASAAGYLHRLTELQAQYAAAYPTKGFACKLSELRPATPAEDSEPTEEFLVSNSRSGYRFALSECTPDANGIVSRYRLTAVPIHRTAADSELHAFCTDQSGQIWHDPSGSAETCLASRRPI